MPPRPASSPPGRTGPAPGAASPLTRRSTLGLLTVLGLGAPALLAGCSSERAGRTGTGPGSGTGPTAAGGGSSARLAAATTDDHLVSTLRHELSRAHAAVTAQARRTPGLHVELAAFAHLHARHARALGGLDPVEPRSSTRTGTTATRLRTSEAHLQALLSAGSASAASGSLAALLASMAAAQAQLVSRL